jgi:hypothetical protein
MSDWISQIVSNCIEGLSTVTAQFPDYCILDNVNYVLAGSSGSPFFEPASVGLAPASVISACWRGYVCTYALTAQRLQLNTLQLILGQFSGERRQRTFVPAQGPIIHGIVPRFTVEPSAFFNNTYDNLHLDIPFTGGFLLADGFIEELYVHMGFHPAWKYTTVIEIVCEAGIVVDRRDVSQHIAEMRSERLSRTLKPGKIEREELKAWIETTFRRDYEL